jgi:hypothetical protein
MIISGEKDDDYDDFNHLEMEKHEAIYFFGGTDSCLYTIR